jgi:Tfp pilus assembly protein PilE
MAAISTIAAITVMAGTAYTVYNSEENKKEAKKQMKDQAATSQRLQNEAKQRMDNEESLATATQVRNDAAAAQRKKSALNTNRSGTLYTSPLGLIGSSDSPSTGGKKLIGE